MNSFLVEAENIITRKYAEYVEYSYGFCFVVALVRAKKRRPQSTQPKETLLVPICRAVYVRFVLSSMSHVETIPPKLTPS